MDADVLAQRILLDLKNTFRKDPLIDEFDILPVHESVRNTCPVIHIDHKVALEDWCVKHVYVYCYNNFFAWKKKITKIDSDTLLLWTMTILLINPEIETVWNTRKELLCQNLFLPEDELKFCDIVLSRKPKSSQAFAHRKWVLLKMKSQLSTCTLHSVIDHEFYLCTKVADKYPNNYYAWCHRSWIIQELLNSCLKTVSEELIRMEAWVTTHVSDYSGFHYRQFLISCFHYSPTTTYSFECPLHKAFQENSEGVKCSFHHVNEDDKLIFSKALEKELVLLCGLQVTFLGHETLWNHRRYILYQFQKIITSDSSSNKIKCTNNAHLVDTLHRKRHKLECNNCYEVDWDIVKEEIFLKDCIKAAKGLEWEKILIQKHIKWLKNVILWTVDISSS